MRGLYYLMSPSSKSLPAILLLALASIILSITSCVVSGIKLSDYRTGRWFHGEGTYYGAGGTEGGNCAMRSPRAAWFNSYVPVAINDAQYARSCGACVEIHGSGKGLGATPITGKIFGVIVDRCPECKHGDIDLSKDGDGRWDIKWKLVPCDTRKYPIEFQFEGSNQFYRKIQPRNMHSPPVKVVVDSVTASKSQDNHWIAQKSSGFNSKYVVQVWTITGEYYSVTLDKYHGVVHPIDGSAKKQFTNPIAPPVISSSTTGSSISATANIPDTCVPNWGICRGEKNKWNTSGKCCNSANFRCLIQRNHLGHQWYQCVEHKAKTITTSTTTITHHLQPLCRAPYQRCGDSYKWRTWEGGWYRGNHCCTSGYHCTRAKKAAKFGGFRCEPDRKKGVKQG